MQDKYICSTQLGQNWCVVIMTVFLQTLGGRGGVGWGVGEVVSMCKRCSCRTKAVNNSRTAKNCKIWRDGIQLIVKGPDIQCKK